MPRAILLTSVSHLTLVLNSSTNILIYCWKVVLNAPKYFYRVSKKSTFRTKAASNAALAPVREAAHLLGWR